MPVRKVGRVSPCAPWATPKCKISATRALARRRSAELHSAVSQIWNLRTVRTTQSLRNFPRFAECNSAIQQIKNLRFGNQRAVGEHEHAGERLATFAAGRGLPALPWGSR